MKDNCCPHCGAKMVKYKHSLNQNLVRALYKFYDKQPPVNLKEVGFTRNEWDNFQKLRYWNLVTQHYKDGSRVGGTWDITENGKKFLAGKLRVYKKVLTYRGETDTYEGELITSDDLWNDIRYKQRPEYAMDAEPFLEFTLTNNRKE